MEKKFFFVFLCFLTMVACDQKELSVSDDLPSSVFRASWTDLKVTLDNRLPSFSEGDAISVWDGTEKYWFETEGGRTAEFTSSVQGAPTASSRPYAIFPYRFEDTRSGNTFTTWLYSNVEAVKNDFIPIYGAPVSIAKSTADGVLNFVNACAILKFQVSEEVASVTIKENGSESDYTLAPLAGNFNITYDGTTLTTSVSEDESTARYLYVTGEDGGNLEPGYEYYVAIAPCTMANGLIIELPDKSDGSTNYKSSPWGVARTFQANTIYNLGTISYIEVDSTNPESAFTGLSTVIPNKDYSFSIALSDDRNLSGLEIGIIKDDDWTSFTSTVTGFDSSASTSSYDYRYWFPLSGTSATFSQTIRFTSSGTYTIAYTVKDASNNYYYASQTVQVSNIAVTLGSAPAAVAGEDYSLSLAFSTTSTFTGSWPNLNFWYWDSGSSTTYYAQPGTGENNWGGPWDGQYKGWCQLTNNSSSVTASWTVVFPAAGTYQMYIDQITDKAGNTYGGANMPIYITVTDGSSGSDEPVVSSEDTVTGLSDGYYDVTFTATRAKSGGTVYVQAQGANTKMTALQYGTGVQHIIKGVRVSGGSCVMSVVEADSSPATYSITSSWTFTRSSEYTFLKGGDISRVSMCEEHGGKYYMGSAQKDGIALIGENGFNIVRIKIMNDPGNSSYSPSKYMSSYSNLSDAVSQAVRAKAAGMQVLLTLYYSDYWADATNQFIPHEWSGKSEAQLRTAVYDFTYNVMTTMIAAGVTPDYVAIGNEINCGLLFGGTSYSGSRNSYWCNWSSCVGFFNQGYAAVKAASSSTQVVCHLANPQNSRARGVFQSLKNNGINYDIAGISYYPYWNDLKASEFVSAAESIYSAFGKKVLVMETALNWNDKDYWGYSGQLVDNGPYESVYPAGEESQKNYLLELSNQLKLADDGCILGYLYWDPMIVLMTSESGLGNDDKGHNNINASLFNYSWKALSAFDAFRYNN